MWTALKRGEETERNEVRKEYVRKLKEGYWRQSIVAGPPVTKESIAAGFSAAGPSTVKESLEAGHWVVGPPVTKESIAAGFSVVGPSVVKGSDGSVFSVAKETREKENEREESPEYGSDDYDLVGEQLRREGSDGVWLSMAKKENKKKETGGEEPSSEHSDEGGISVVKEEENGGEEIQEDAAEEWETSSEDDTDGGGVSLFEQLFIDSEGKGRRVEGRSSV